MKPDPKNVITPPLGTAVHIDMTNDEYHSTGNWSHSQLRLLPHDPEMFDWKHIQKRERFNATRAMICGTAFHAWILEGIEPTVVPGGYLTKSGGMKPGGWNQVAEEFPDVPVLKADELTGIKIARENCFADPEIRAYLETEGEVEHSLFSVDEETGLPIRVRLDKLCNFSDGLIPFDVKYTAKVDDRWTDSQVTGMDYYSQAGMYSELVERAYKKPIAWVFLFAQSVPPYTCRVKELLWQDIDLGARHTHVSLRDLAARLKTDDWRGEGYGALGITKVAQWKWDENPQPVQPYQEFDEFSTIEIKE